MSVRLPATGLGRILLPLLALFLLAPSAACADQGARDPEAALRSGEYDGAIQGFTRRLEEQPDDVAARRALVFALSEVGRYEDAERVAREAEADPEMANALGEVLYTRGNIAEAEAAFRRAEDAGASDRLTARLNRAVLLHERGERDAAMALFDSFIDEYNSSSSLSAADLIAVGTAVRYLGATDPELFRDALKAFDEAIAAAPDDQEARIRLGNLFIEKYNSPDAQETLKEVLAVNPRHPRALLAMARALSFDGAPTAEEVVRQSLDVNPNLIPARVQLAWFLLDKEDDAAAEEEVRKALEVNPSSLEALSMLAALHYLRDEQREFEATRQQVLRLNPRYSELYATLAELSVRRRRYADAVELARQGIAIDESAWALYSLLGVNELRLGRVEDAQRSLDKAFAGDPYNVWTKNTLDLLDTYDEYETVRTPRFELVMHRDEVALLGPYAARLAEEAYDSLAARYGYSPEPPVRIEFFPRHADFSVRTMGLAGLGALGVAFGNVLAMDSPAARERGQFNWGSTLWHELAHTVTLGLSRNRVPRWLTEGLSVVDERRARPGWGDDVRPEFLLALEQDEMVAASELSDWFVSPPTPQHLGLAYLAASYLVEMIERDHGFDAIVRMLRGYGEGRSTDELLRSVLRLDPEELDERYDRYLRERFARQLDAMDDDFPAELQGGRMLVEAGRFDEARERLERARDLFPEYTGEDSPYRLLATVHQQLGNPQAAAEELARLAAIDENAYQANLDAAELLEALGDTRGAAAALERVIFIFPYEISLHERLADLYRALGDREGVVRERQAVVALNPVDRAGALYQLALAMMEAGDTAGARREVLRALEEAPTFPAAQELLLRLQGP